MKKKTQKMGIFSRGKEPSKAKAFAEDPSKGKVDNGIAVDEVPGSDMTETQKNLIDQEDRWRQLYSEDPSCSELQDLHLGLTNVFSNRDLFRYEEETPEEKSVPKLLAKKRRQNFDQLAQRRDYSVMSQTEFSNGWKEFTQNMFEGLNWNNLFIAGGSILANLLSAEDAKQGFKGSDIDIFIYGITNDQEANEKLRHIYEVVKKNSLGTGEVIRSGRAITILGKYPHRHVQIITRLYKSPAEVLVGFDIDCCTVGYDGRDLWATERFIRSVNKCYNLVNKTRRSITYESRLYKYSKRGFAVTVPLLDKTKINEDLFNNPYEMKNGLARLLTYDFYSRTSGYQSRYSSLAWNVKKRLGKKIGHLVDEFNQDRLEDFSILTNNKPSDYSEVYLPWGPDWKPSDVVKIIEFSDRANMFGLGQSEVTQRNSDKTLTNMPQKGKQQVVRRLVVPHKHLFVSGLENVIHGNVNAFWCQHCHDHVPLEGNDTRFIRGALVWAKDSTSYQDIDKGFRRTLITGSFNPLPDEDWEKGVYSNSNSNSISNSNSGTENKCSQCTLSFVSANQLAKHVRDNHSYSTPVSSYNSNININNNSNSISSNNNANSNNNSIINNNSFSSSFGVQPGMSLNFTSNTTAPLTPSKYGGPSGVTHSSINETSQYPSYQSQPQSQPSYQSQHQSQSQPQSSPVTYVPPSTTTSSFYNRRIENTVPWHGKQISMMTKGFLIVGLLFREGKLNEQQRNTLKAYTISGNDVFNSIIEAFEISEDFDDLVDSMRNISLK